VLRQIHVANIGQRRACAFCSALGKAVGQDRGIHRSRPGAGNTLDLEPGLLEKPIEYPHVKAP
jgi:hypothetical protein